MAEVKIYKVTCTKGFLADDTGINYSLLPWGNNTDQYEGSDDGGNIYTLPDGYTLQESNSGDMQIYGPDGNYCSLTKKLRSPAIVDGDNVIMLAKAPEHFKSAGKWWNGGQEQIIKDGKVYALHGWNGESYTESWLVVKGIDAVGKFDIRPVYAQQAGDSDFVVIDYEITER